MFELGDIIKHKRSGIHYIIVAKNIYLGQTTERIEYIASGGNNGSDIVIHYPLMTVNYEKVC